MRFTSTRDEATELREQYTLNLVRAIVATNDRLKEDVSLWLRKHHVETPIRFVSDALAAAAAVGNFRAVDHLLHSTTDLLEQPWCHDMKYLPSVLQAAASTGKSVMVEYLLAKVKVGLDMNNVSCKIWREKDWLS
jgi:hypothetical protein